MVWDEILKVAAANGIWALLFVALLVFELTDSKKRELKYQETIENLSKNLDIVEDVKEDVREIKDTLSNEKRKREAEI